MEQVQLKLKSKDRFLVGEAIIYAGNFAILQTKEVKDGKLVISQQPYPLDDIQHVTIVRDAESRELPMADKQLLVEESPPYCGCGCATDKAADKDS